MVLDIQQGYLQPTTVAPQTFLPPEMRQGYIPPTLSGPAPYIMPPETQLGERWAAPPPAPVAPVPAPTPAPPPPDPYTDWYQAAAPAQAEGTTIDNYIQQAIYNQMIPYMDPITQRETALWLARANPTAYSKYAGLDPVGGNVPLTAGQAGPLGAQGAVGNLAGTLDFSKILGGLPKAVQDKIKPTTALGARSGVGWLQEALRTAMGGTKGTTRAKQQLAGGHLATLMREAGQEPGRGGMYKTLFENLMNPIRQRAPASGLFGSGRALSNPAGSFRRKGVAFRNVGLT